MRKNAIDVEKLAIHRKNVELLCSWTMKDSFRKKINVKMLKKISLR